MSKAAEHEFDTYAGYRAALLAAIDGAQREILLFDPDLKETGLESIAGAEALNRFLLRSSAREAIRLLLGDPEFLDRHCPRLTRLLELHGHRFAVRIDGNDRLHPLHQPFAVVDGHHLVTRFHQDRPRGKACPDDAAVCAPLVAQFETIWIGAEPGKSGAPLGI